MPRSDPGGRRRGQPFERPAFDHDARPGRGDRRAEHQGRIPQVGFVREAHFGALDPQPGTDRPGPRRSRAHTWNGPPSPRVVAGPRDGSSGFGDPSHQLVGARQAEGCGDAGLVLQRQHVRRPRGQALQHDAGVEQRRVRRVEHDIVSVEQDRVRGLRPPERVDVAQPSPAFLQIGLRPERDLPGLLVPLLHALGEL